VCAWDVQVVPSGEVREVFSATVTKPLPLLAAWLLFFPSAPYILTDLIHLSPHNHGHVPLWLDLVMLLSFAFVALGVGFQSLHIVQRWLAGSFSSLASWLVVIGSLGLSGFGVYLGRFLRWNSWDIVRHPATLWNDILARLLHPLAHGHTWGFTLGFGTLLILAYLFWISAATVPREERNLG
jgi:uncharacterized membrane protein